MKKIKSNYMELGLWILLLFQFGMIIFCNLTLIDKNLDCDNAKLFFHIMEICKQKTVALPDWSYVSTLELDCGSLFAIPFYAITGNIFLSYGLSNTVLTGLFIAVIFFLFKRENVLYPLLSSNLICIPYAFGMLDYFNMMFFAGSQYVIKVMVPLILVGLMLAAEECAQYKKNISLSMIVFAVLYVGMLFLCCLSSGVYVVACGVIPVFGVYVVYKFFKAERISISVVALMVISALCLLVGNHFNSSIIGGARGNSMVFTSASWLLTNVATCFFGMFELFGGTTTSTELPIFSLDGLLIITKIFIVWVILISAVINIRKVREGNLRTLLLLAIFVWNYFVLNVANVRAGTPTFEYRYHLIGMIPLVCIAGKTLIDGLYGLKMWQQKCLYVIGIMVLLFVSGASFKTVISNGEQNAELKEVCAYLEKYNLDYVYMYYGSNDSEICRLLDDSKLYLHVGDEARTWVYDYYSYYIDAPIQTDSAVVVVKDAEYNLGDTFQLAEYTLEKVDNIAGRSIYCFLY